MGPQVLRMTTVTLTLLAAMPVLAQDAADSPGATVTAVDTEDDGSNWGWVGLLGLLGLGGLGGRRRDTHTVQDKIAPRV